jgi:hypothetical protein
LVSVSGIPPGCGGRQGGGSPWGAVHTGAAPDHRTATHGYDRPSLRNNTASAAGHPHGDRYAVNRNSGQARSRMRSGRLFLWFPFPASLRDAAVRGAAPRGAPSTPGALPDHRTATHGYDLPSLWDNTGSACQNKSHEEYTPTIPHPHHPEGMTDHSRGWPSFPGPPAPFTDGPPRIPTPPGIAPRRGARSASPRPRPTTSLIPHPSSFILHPLRTPTRASLPAPAIPEGCQSRAGGRSCAQTSGSRSPNHASRRDARNGHVERDRRNKGRSRKKARPRTRPEATDRIRRRCGGFAARTRCRFPAAPYSAASGLRSARVLS